MIAINLALATIPAALLLAWAYRRDKRRPEPPGLVFRAFLGGIVATVVAIGLGLAIGPVEAYFTGAARDAFAAYVVAGLIEEAVKLAVVLVIVARRAEFDEVADGLVYGMAASLGFAVLENVLYLADPPAVLLVRGFTAVPLHGSAGAILGYFVGMNRIEHRTSVATGLLLAVVLHGTYDFFLYRGGLLAFAVLPLLAVALAAVGALFRNALKLDEQAGRIRPVT